MPLRATTDAFEARLSEIRAHAEFVRRGLQITRILSDHIDHASLSGNARAHAAFREYVAALPNVRRDDIGAALIVQAFASFEWFIRSALTASVNYLNTHTNAFDDLPSTVSRWNTRLSGRVLASQAEAPRHLQVNTATYCIRLGGCYPSSTAFELNADAFALFLPVLDAGALVKALKRLGFDLKWDDIGRSQEIKTLLGTNSVRRAGKAAEARLDHLADMRNMVAHHGAGTRTVGLDELDESLNFLGLFAVQLSSLLTAFLTDAIKHS